jgi:hypothetical protein
MIIYTEQVQKEEEVVQQQQQQKDQDQGHEQVHIYIDR